jgi:hypothetical protein
MTQLVLAPNSNAQKHVLDHKNTKGKQSLKVPNNGIPGITCCLMTDDFAYKQ